MYRYSALSLVGLLLTGCAGQTPRTTRSSAARGFRRRRPARSRVGRRIPTTRRRRWCRCLRGPRPVARRRRRGCLPRAGPVGGYSTVRPAFDFAVLPVSAARDRNVAPSGVPGRVRIAAGIAPNLLAPRPLSTVRRGVRAGRPALCRRVRQPGQATPRHRLAADGATLGHRRLPGQRLRQQRRPSRARRRRRRVPPR